MEDFKTRFLSDISHIKKTLSHSFFLSDMDAQKKVAMLDIETAGLGLSDPILQIGLTQQGKPLLDLNIFPVSFEKDRSRFDQAGKLRRPDYIIRDTPILNEKDFLDTYGSWAYDHDYHVKDLYRELGSIGDNTLFEQLKEDLRFKDTINLADYGLRSMEMHTPRGAAKKLILQLKQLSDSGAILAAHNMPFESSRLGNLIAAFIDEARDSPLPKGRVALNQDPDIVKAFGRELTGYDDIRQLLRASYTSPKKHNILDPNNLDYISARSRLEASGEFADKATTILPELEKSFSPGRGLPIIDTQEYNKMIFSGMQALGFTPRSKDVYSGSAVNYATEIMFKRAELHGAVPDALDQEDMISRTRRAALLTHIMQKGKESSGIMDRVRGFGAATQALFSDEFFDAYAYAKSRFAQVDFFDKSINVNYSGPAVTVMKQRSIDRSLAIMNESLNALLDPNYSGRYKIKKAFDPSKKEWVTELASGDWFGVTSDQSKQIKWTSGDLSLTETRLRVTDTKLYPRILAKWNRELGEKGEVALRAEIEKEVLEMYRDSRAIQSSDMYDVSLEDLESRLASVKAGGQGFLAEVTQKGDKAFKDEVLWSMREVGWSETTKSEYLLDYLKSNKKGVIGLGAMAALGAIGAYSQLKSNTQEAIGVKDQRYGSIVSMIRESGDSRDDYDPVYAYEETGLSSFGMSEEELYQKFVYGQTFDPETQRILDAGNVAHEYYEREKLRAGQATAAEQFVADASSGLSSYVDIVDNQGNPLDIKTASPRSLARVRERGPSYKNRSQLNAYLHIMGREQGTLEYINRINPNDRESVTIQYDEGLYYRDLQRLNRVRSRIQEEIHTGQLDPSQLQRAESMAARSTGNNKVGGFLPNSLQHALYTSYFRAAAGPSAINSSANSPELSIINTDPYMSASMAQMQNEALAVMMQQHSGRSSSRR